MWVCMLCRSLTDSCPALHYYCRAPLQTGHCCSHIACVLVNHCCQGLSLVGFEFYYLLIVSPLCMHWPEADRRCGPPSAAGVCHPMYSNIILAAVLLPPTALTWGSEGVP